MFSSTDDTKYDLAEINNSGFNVLLQERAPLRNKNTALRYSDEFREAQHEHEKTEPLWP